MYPQAFVLELEVEADIDHARTVVGHNLRQARGHTTTAIGHLLFICSYENGSSQTEQSGHRQTDHPSDGVDIIKALHSHRQCLFSSSV